MVIPTRPSVRTCVHPSMHPLVQNLRPYHKHITVDYIDLKRYFEGCLLNVVYFKKDFDVVDHSFLLINLPHTWFSTFLWIFYVCSVFCLLCLCARLFICALWSPAGKGLTSWLSFVVSKGVFVTFPLVSWVSCGT